MLFCRSHVRLQSLGTLRTTSAIRNAGYSAATVRKALRLQDVANDHPTDATIQAAFLKELGELSPQAVIRRVESNKYAKNVLVNQEYLKALAMADRLTSKELSSVFQDIASSTGTGMLSGNLHPELGSRINLTSGLSSSNPLKLHMPTPTLKNEIWATIRMFLGAVLMVSGAIYVSDLLSPPSDSSNKFGVSDSEYAPIPAGSKSFADIRGCDEAVHELQAIVHYLKDPTVYSTVGGKLPKGVLLTGPPGTGKTLLARVVSSEAGVPFFYASGSEFDEVYVGVGARRIKALFQAAKKQAPCILFIDEIDAVGGKRNPRDSQSSKMTLNQLLVEMDGFEGDSGVFVIGATNLPELLDSALTRPGRFDQQIVVQAPDVKGREHILSLYLENVKTNTDISDISRTIARGTPGFTGADLENLVNIASIHATAQNAAAVSLAHLEHAREKILMGAERKNFRVTPEGRECTAHHEAGHALVAALSNDADPVYKATIVPRGMALGMVQQLPRDDEYQVNVSQMRSRLHTLMAGRVAEELLLGSHDYTSGASSDLEQASSLARDMVTRWGLSSKLGPMCLGEEGYPVSPALQRMVDEEVQNILKNAYENAKSTIISNRAAHLAIANALLERETLTGAEIHELIQRANFPAAATSSQTSTIVPKHFPTPANGVKIPEVVGVASYSSMSD